MTLVIPTHDAHTKEGRMQLTASKRIWISATMHACQSCVLQQGTCSKRLQIPCPARPMHTHEPTPVVFSAVPTSALLVTAQYLRLLLSFVGRLRAHHNSCRCQCAQSIPIR